MPLFLGVARTAVPVVIWVIQIWIVTQLLINQLALREKIGWQIPNRMQNFWLEV